MKLIISLLLCAVLSELFRINEGFMVVRCWKVSRLGKDFFVLMKSLSFGFLIFITAFLLLVSMKLPLLVFLLSFTYFPLIK
jgi:hypothetical protein